MKDALSRIRRKHSFTTEVRFTPIPRFVDLRGQIVDVLFSAFGKDLPQWTIADGHVALADDMQKPGNQVFVSTRQVIVVMEDANSVERFRDRANKTLGFIYSALGSMIPTADRIGVRFREILTHPGIDDFDKIREYLRGRLLSQTQIDVGTPILDWHLRQTHKSGQFVVGPVKKGEQWVTASFTDSDEGVPNAGIGIDVDSFASNITLSSTEDLCRAFGLVLDITQSVEERIGISLGLLDG